MSRHTQTLLIATILCSIAGAAYVMVERTKVNAASDLPGLVDTATGAAVNPLMPTTNTVGQDFLTLLLSIQSIKLDSGIFASKAFISLQDFSRPIPPDNNPGRPNPFAPLGADSAAVSTQVSTSNVSSLTSTGATLNGTVTVSNSERWFEYGTTTALGTATPHRAQSTPGAFAESIAGLTPNTTYYAKAVAIIGGQTVAGNQITFTTAQASGINTSGGPR